MSARGLSFRARLTLRWTLAFGLLLAAAHVAIYAGSREYAWRDLEAQLATLAATELASAVDEYRGLHLHDFPIDSLSPRPYADKFAQIVDGQGRVLHASVLAGGSPALVQGERLREALAGRTPLFTISVNGRAARATALRVAKDRRAYVLVVGLYTERLERSLARLRLLLAGVWAGGLLLTAALGFGLSSSALAPIERITQRAAAIARGQFSARLDPPAVDDEIGRMTRLLNEMLASLERAIEVNRRFAADASHELRSPLTAVRGEVEVALKRERTPAEYRETLVFVQRQAEEMSELSENLMLLVRAHEGRSALHVTEVPLGEALRATGARVQALAERRGVELAFERLPDLIVYADPRLLARALDNLLRNAVQYNRRGGRVALSGALHEPDGTEWSAPTAVLRIRDTGLGIPEGERERIFERFYRVDPSRSRRTGGAGLGLALCREVLTLMGGGVRVAESSSQGSVFELTLPGKARSARHDDGPLFAAPPRPSAHLTRAELE